MMFLCNACGKKFEVPFNKGAMLGKEVRNCKHCFSSWVTYLEPKTAK